MRKGLRREQGIAFSSSPALVFVVLLFVYPFLYGLYLSFTSADGSSDPGQLRALLHRRVGPRTIWVTL